MRHTNSSSRFTVLGSLLLDEQIKRDLKHIVHFLRDHQDPKLGELAGIWLGGSYGRQEGAVYRNGDSEKPFFDYDLFLIYQQNYQAKSLYRKYRIWEQQLKDKVSLTVDLRVAGSVSEMKNLPRRLIWYDLAQHHQSLWELSPIETDFASAKPFSPEIALALLLYWGAFLIPLRQAEAFDNRAACQWYRIIQALGDACLIVEQKYHSSRQERVRQFSQWQRELSLPWGRELDYLYQEATQFFLLPSDCIAEQKHLQQRTPRLIKLFLDVYLYIFDCFTQLSPDLNHFERLFLAPPKGLSLPVQHFLKRFRPTAAARRLLPNSEAYRLYYLLPFLLRGVLPAQETLAQVCPELKQAFSLQQLELYFQSLWANIEDQLI